jgi:hypothetical protein
MCVKTDGVSKYKGNFIVSDVAHDRAMTAIENAVRRVVNKAA